MKRYACVAALLALAVLNFAGPIAAGEQVPFKGALEGNDQLVVPPPVAMVDSVGGGNATELGRFSYELLATVDFRVPPPHGEGILTLTAADGSTLTAETDGFSTPLIPGVLVLVMEEAVIVDGTGRFAGASGAFIMERMVYQDTRLTVGSFEGTISIPGKR